MAENKNLDELNMLQNDGKVDTTQAIEEDRKEVEAVAKGKKTVDEAPQAVTVELLKEYAIKNKIFGKIESHCEQDGVDIYSKFINCFENNETVKISEIVEVIGKKIPKLIDVINDDKSNNLYIDGNGNIDVEAAIRKARENVRQIPEYIKAIAEDAGKSEVNTNTIHNYTLSDERKEEYLQFKDEILDVLEKSRSDEDFKKILDLVSGWESGKDNVNKPPKELYVATKVIEDIDEFLKNFDVPIDIDGEKKLAIIGFSKLKALEDLLGQELPESLKNQINTRIDIVKRTILKTHVVEKIEDITPEKLEELLSQEFIVKDAEGNEIKKSYREIYDAENKSYKDKLKRIEKSYEETRLTEQEIKDNIAQNYETVMSNNDFKTSVNYLRILPYLSKINNNEEIDFSEDDVDKHIAKFFKNDPEKLKLLKESRASFVRDDTSDIKIRTLKRMCFEDFFDNYEVGTKNLFTNIKDPEKRERAFLARECNLIRYSIEFALGDTEGYFKTLDDDLMQTRAKENLKKYLPQAFDKDGKIDKAKLFEEYKKKYGVFKIVSKLNSFDDMVKDSNARTMSVLKAKITSEMVGTDKSVIFGSRKASEISNSKEFLEEVSLKCNKRRDVDFEHKFKDIMIKRFQESKNKVDSKINKPGALIDLVKNAVVILTWREMKPGNFDAHILEMAKQVIAEKIPSALTNGEIDREKLKTEYKKYIIQKSEEAELQPLDYGDDPLKDEFKNLEKIYRQYYDIEKLKQSPDEWRKHNIEIKENANKNRKIIKGQEERAVYEFINIITKGRKEISPDNLHEGTTTNFNELLKLVDKRLKNRTGDDTEYRSYTKGIEGKKLDPNEYKSFVRESKLTLVRGEANDLISIIASKDKDNKDNKDNKNNKMSKEDAKKRVFEYFIGIKRDLEESPVTDNDNTHKVRRINFLMKKIAPEVFQGDKVNEDILLAKYNELFGVNIENVDDMFQRVEDELLGRYAGKIIEAIDSKEGYTGPYVQPLVGRNFFRRVAEERYVAKNNVEHKVTEKEMKSIMDRDAVELVVDTTELHRKKSGEIKREESSQVISSKDMDAVFETSSVELGGEEQKRAENAIKAEQQVDSTEQTIHVDNIEISSDSKTNLPIKKQEKGFFANIFGIVKDFVVDKFKNIKESVFGNSDSNNNGTTDSATSTNSSGGVNKTEQDRVTDLTGYGKFNLKLNNQTPTVEDDKGKKIDALEKVVSEGEEK